MHMHLLKHMLVMHEHGVIGVESIQRSMEDAYYVHTLAAAPRGGSAPGDTHTSSSQFRDEPATAPVVVQTIGMAANGSVGAPQALNGQDTSGGVPAPNRRQLKRPRPTGGVKNGSTDGTNGGSHSNDTPQATPASAAAAAATMPTAMRHEPAATRKSKRQRLPHNSCVDVATPQV